MFSVVGGEPLGAWGLYLYKFTGVRMEADELLMPCRSESRMYVHFLGWDCAQI